MKEINVIGNPKSLVNFNIIGGQGAVDIVTSKESNSSWITEQSSVYDEQIKNLTDLLVTEDNFKYLRNFITTYLKVNNITLEKLKESINNKTSDLTKSQRDFVINNL